ncbi:hypothetical protein [Bacterioplanoides sp.]|uniref:hypothetical protein n=1 Tax=Bacterioplanoides sp. TaxID=2066072 RepID=UPI003B0053FE
MAIDTQYLQRCADTLALAYQELNSKKPDDLIYDIYRAACVKEFEIVLEQSGKLLKKRLAVFFPTNKDVDRLAFSL